MVLYSSRGPFLLRRDMAQRPIIIPLYIIRVIRRKLFIINYIQASPKIEDRPMKMSRSASCRCSKAMCSFSAKTGYECIGRLVGRHSELLESGFRNPRERRHTTSSSCPEKVLSSLPRAPALPQIGSPATRSTYSAGFSSEEMIRRTANLQSMHTG